MNGLLTLALLAGATLAPGDTLVEVRAGDHLVLQNFMGQVVVESWDRSALSLEAEAEGSIRFRLQRSGSRLELRIEDEKNRNRAEALRIVVPRWMGVELSGRDLEASVRDLEGSVSVRNLTGDILLRNLSGAVEATTVEGGVDALGLSGSSVLRTGDDELRVGSSSGTLELETVEGDIRLEGITASRVSVRTTDGDVDFSGQIPRGADFRFYSHDGDLDLNLAGTVNAEVTVLVYGGEFTSDFPVRTRGFRSGEGMTFTLGSGGATLVLETFDGDISLREVSMMAGLRSGRRGG